MLGEIAKTIKAGLYERVTSPLLGSFLISWTLWNYKFVAVIFASIPPQEKLSLIENTIFPTISSSLTRGGLYPLLTTICFIFIYPHPARFVYEFWRKEQKKLKEIRQKIEDETPLTVDEARKIKREALNIELKYDVEIETKNNEIKRLKEELEATKQKYLSVKIVDTEDSNGNISKDIDVSNFIINDEQLNLLRLIGQSNKYITENSAINQSNASRVKTEYNLGELLNNEYVSKDYSTKERDYYYSLTHKGRTALVDMGQAE
jgi:hypothetical protein